MLTLLRTKLYLSDLKTKFVLRCKHFLRRLQKPVSYCCIGGEKIAVCSEIHAKYKNASWAKHRLSECKIWWYIK